MTIKLASRKFTALDILNRASEYGMVVSLLGDNLAVDVPSNLDEGKKERAIEVIKTHKPEIVAYLRSLTSPAICCTCLDMNPPVETPAIAEYKGVMYCEEHLPGKGEMVNHPVVQEVVRLFGAQIRETIPTSELASWKASVLQEYCKASARPPKPIVPCIHCNVFAWTWSTADGPEWICLYCYSPASGG